MKVTWSKVHYPLVFPFKLSYGTYFERTSIIIQVSQGGLTGYGEMSFVPYYLKNEEDIVSQLEEIIQYLSEFTGDWNPWDSYDNIRQQFNPDSIVLSAVDCALYDLYGKRIKKPIWQIVDADKKVKVRSTLTLTEDDWKRKLDWNWPLLKLKMGFDGDMELLNEIRARYDGPLRIDANSGWTVSGLQNRQEGLVLARVEIVEQPVSPEEESHLRNLNFPIPLMADESVQGMENLDEVSEMYQGINIKLQKCGGITPALRLIRKARNRGLALMAGCMTESSVGIGAMAHLGSYFDYLDLDGEHLIQADFGNEKYVEKGEVKLKGEGGLGQDFVI